MFAAPRAGCRAGRALLILLVGCALAAAACGRSKSSGTGGDFTMVGTEARSGLAIFVP